MDAELLLFAVGNLAWMAATAGLFHLDAPARLCVNYLQDDQRHTGIGLIALAALAGALVLRRVCAPRKPRASAAASDIIEKRSQGGSDTTSTVASPTSDGASGLSAGVIGDGLASMPQPGAVGVIGHLTRKPFVIGSTSQPWTRPSSTMSTGISGS